MTYQATPSGTTPFTAIRKHSRIGVADLSRPVGERSGQLFDHAASVGAGPRQAAYPGSSDPEDEIEVDLLLPAEQPTGQEGDDLIQWPGVPATHTLHTDPYGRMGQAHETLKGRGSAHGHRRASPHEFYLSGPDVTAEPEGCLTDIVVPVATSRR